MADDEELERKLPEQRNRAYNVKPLIDGILDGPMEELQAKWAPNVVVGLGRLGGRSVGVVANNPLRLGGCLDSTSAEKASRFVRMCDAFGIPLLVVVDVPGYLPGVGQEWDGVVRRGAKLLHAFAEAVVPRVTLVTRKAYGGAYIAMNSKALGATAVFAWPDAEIAVMGAKAAVGILHRAQTGGSPRRRAGRPARHPGAGTREGRRRGRPGHRAGRGGRGDHPGADPAAGGGSAGVRAGRPRQPRQHPPVIHLIGGGWDPEHAVTVYGGLLAEAGDVAARSGRPGKPVIACVVYDEGDGRAQFARWESVLTTIAFCEPVPVLVGHDAPLDVTALGNSDALLVCGGLTPGYAKAIAPAAVDVLDWLLLGGRPYAGFSAGSVVAAADALVGGWLATASRSARRTPRRTSPRSSCGPDSGWCRSWSTCTAPSGAPCRG